MITRPLELAARLRAEPRSFDCLFYVNAALLAGFFVFFGSRFVLSPGLGIDFALPESPGANAQARPTTHVITIVNAGQILVPEGVRTIDQIGEWLNREAKTARQPSLLIKASAGVPTALSARVMGMASTAGFAVTLAAEEPKLPAESGRR